jgi:hypothetical protein
VSRQAATPASARGVLRPLAAAVSRRDGTTRAALAVVAALLGSTFAFAQGQPVVRVSFQPAGPVIVGQQVTLTVQVLAPNYFLSAPDWPVLDIDGAIVTMPDEVMPHLTETIGGESYAGVQKSYVIATQQEGEFVLPPAEIRFKYAAIPGQPPTDGVVTLPPERFSARWPEGARTDAGVLPVARLAVEQTLDRSLTGLKAGDAITRTITVVAARTQAMMIPPPAIEAPDGVRLYREDPSLSSDLGARGELNAGRRVDRVTYLFEEPGHYTLPAVDFPWFDESSNTRRTATAPAIIVDVAPNTAATPAIAPEAPPPAPEPPPPSPGLVWRQRLPWILGGLAILVTFNWAARRIWPGSRHWSATRQKVYAESEPAAFAAFERACDTNDRARAYTALARWAARADHGSIGDWCQTLAHERFTSEVSALEASMFSATGPEAASWSGAALKRSALEARSRWQSGQSRERGRTSHLPDLNPRWSR